MRSLFKKWIKSEERRVFRVPDGQRVYAVGDIHGRLDLFEGLIAQIEEDDARRGPAETTVVLLGDLVDRGPDSAGVIDAAIAWSARRRVRTLCGNHEEMFLKSLESEKVLREFLRFGGRETVLSYPIEPHEYAELTFEDLRKRLCTLVPLEHLEFLKGLEDWIVIGDYLFVHAGIRPGVAIDKQSVQDLRWIREPFLSADAPSPYCVVHGHTIYDQPLEQSGRVGIDTGAYQSGVLTTLGLEGERRWFVATTKATS
jgi:serine/threonine protein phosphatase 1